jgi:hypothetical protein
LISRADLEQRLQAARKSIVSSLGHPQIGITLDTYSHVVPTLQLEAASKLDVLMRCSQKNGKSRRA